MASLRDALLKAEKISEAQFKAEEEQKRAQQADEARRQVEVIEQARVASLLEQIKRVTTIRKFRGCARSLLLLRPEYISTVHTCAKALPSQEGWEALQTQVDHLYEWLPSLPPEEQDELVK